MSNQIEFRHFRYFLAVAKELHFRKAADKLYISQPGLSRQIKQMEDQLEIQLFERHNRKVELTQSGRYLQRELTDSFKRIDQILAHAKLINDGVDGKLRLGYVGSAMQKVIPEILVKFQQIHPNCSINLTEIENNNQVESLLNQTIDIGFVRLERVPRELEIKPLLEDTFSIVLPKDHWLDSTNFKDLEQLKDEHFILFDQSYSRSYYEKVMQIFDNSHFTPIVSHSTVNASSIYRLVESNFGVSIVPTSLKWGYDLDIKFIDLVDIPQRTTLKMIWNSQSTNPILDKFIAIAEQLYTI